MVLYEAVYHLKLLIFPYQSSCVAITINHLESDQVSKYYHLPGVAWNQLELDALEQDLSLPAPSPEGCLLPQGEQLGESGGLVGLRNGSLLAGV